MIGEHLDSYDFEYLLRIGLASAPDTMDKREGSPLYDAVAGTAKIVERGFSEMRQIYRDTFAQSAGGEALVLRTAENGVNKENATAAIRKGVFTGNDDLPYSVPIGARFTAMGTRAVNFMVMEETEVGVYKLKCEETGIIGNEYIGAILPIEIRSGLKTAVLSDILVPGEEAEEDEHLRNRYFEEKNSKKFGGNIDQYREWITAQDGVGACQIYPVWDGGGTVKISFADSNFMGASEEHVEIIQKALDPTKDGQGLGLAPIDHVVTVTTPAEKTIDIGAKIQLMGGYTLSQLQPLIKGEIEKYFAAVRESWGEPVSRDSNQYALAVFRSQVSAAILRVIGVMNVTELLLNGTDGDITLSEDAELQEVPVLGVVSLA